MVGVPARIHLRQSTIDIHPRLRLHGFLVHNFDRRKLDCEFVVFYDSVKTNDYVERGAGAAIAGGYDYNCRCAED